MKLSVCRSVAVFGIAALAWFATRGVAFSAPPAPQTPPKAQTSAVAQAPAVTPPPVVATRLVPAQPSLAGPERIGVLVFFNFKPASEGLLTRLPSWLGGTGRPIVLDREPVITGTDPAPFARAFIVARTLAVTGSVLPALFGLAQARPAGVKTPDQQAMNDLRTAIGKIFAQVGINQIEFTAAWNAPATSAGLVRARAMSARFQVTGAPVLIVNGQWKILHASGASVADILAALNLKLTTAATRIAANR